MSRGRTVASSLGGGRLGLHTWPVTSKYARRSLFSAYNQTCFDEGAPSHLLHHPPQPTRGAADPTRCTPARARRQPLARHVPAMFVTSPLRLPAVARRYH
eukprot:scaffold88828_cov49-Phaeocystis_antarctica.AAC.2